MVARERLAPSASQIVVKGSEAFTLRTQPSRGWNSHRAPQLGCRPMSLPVSHVHTYVFWFPLNCVCVNLVRYCVCYCRTCLLEVENLPCMWYHLFFSCSPAWRHRLIPLSTWWRWSRRKLNPTTTVRSNDASATIAWSCASLSRSVAGEQLFFARVKKKAMGHRIPYVLMSHTVALFDPHRVVIHLSTEHTTLRGSKGARGHQNVCPHSWTPSTRKF